MQYRTVEPEINGIPANLNTQVFWEDRVREGLLYAGTEFKMFASFNAGKLWEIFNRFYS